MQSEIMQRLYTIEKENNIKILYAIESGSRGWGFASKDSDYDVRFIYTHPTDWYLSIEDKKDFIEIPINDLLDINGWDIRKALLQYKKSNPTLMEWLSSPIVYMENYSTAQRMRELLPAYFSPVPTIPESEYEDIASSPLGSSLGTIGGGNHFAELQEIETVFDEESFTHIGFEKNQIMLLIHSGSRGYGQTILDESIKLHEAQNGLQSTSHAAREYIAKHDHAVHWATINRELIV